MITPMLFGGFFSLDTLPKPVNNLSPTSPYPDRFGVAVGPSPLIDARNNHADDFSLEV